ncbi:unnamed protein product [Microthlaspi erraticum]|uniref:Uncharacterized protein n=1 Tax=Microthlaspi erraticum TaxID=1685480 RepID=A0A6D2I659_9BRAS|nr:unnamed protein product [Microthlaspi erraticum]
MLNRDPPVLELPVPIEAYRSFLGSSLVRSENLEEINEAFESISSLLSDAKGLRSDQAFVNDDDVNNNDMKKKKTKFDDEEMDLDDQLIDIATLFEGLLRDELEEFAASFPMSSQTAVGNVLMEAKGPNTQRLMMICRRIQICCFLTLRVLKTEI